MVGEQWVVLKVNLGLLQENAEVLIWTLMARNIDEETKVCYYTGSEQWKPHLNRIKLTAKQQVPQLFSLRGLPPNLIRSLHHRSPRMRSPDTHSWQVSRENLLFHQKSTLRKYLERNVLPQYSTTCNKGAGKAKAGGKVLVSAVLGRQSQAVPWSSLACLSNWVSEFWILGSDNVSKHMVDDS